MIKYFIKKMFIFLKTIFFYLNNFQKIHFIGFPILYLEKGSNFDFGKNILINSGNYSNLIGTNRSIIVVVKGAYLKLGSQVGLSGVSIYCRCKITIGSNVKIGSNSKIFDSDFHPLDYKARRDNNNRFYASQKPVKIGDDVFIGEGVLVLKGSEIGSRSIVAARTVVNGFVPSDSIAYGNPMKIRPIKNA